MKDRISKKDFVWIIKISLGSCIALVLAESLDLQNVASAGTIALLTIATTRWETLRLSLKRVISFVITVLLAWILFTYISVWWMAYGIFIFVLFIISYHLNLKNTSSVNTVIGAHFLMEERFTIDFVINELLLVLIGITIAIIFNMFHLNKGHKKGLIEKIQYTEKKLQDILEELALFLIEDTWTRDVWVEIDVIKKEIKQFRLEAYYYRENTFDSRTGYYMEYFEMRLKQCEILDNLHSEMLKIRSVPIQAKVVADYILYLKGFVDEDNNPEMQLVRLYELLERMREEPLPISREEFETRAILYHMLMDLEEFVIYKSKYYEAISYIASK